VAPRPRLPGTVLSAVGSSTPGDRSADNEHVVVDLVTYCSISSNDVSEPCAGDFPQFPVGQRSLIPETIAITQRFELRYYDSVKQLTQRRPGHRALGQACNPDIHVVHRAVDGGELLLYLHRIGDFRKARFY